MRTFGLVPAAGKSQRMGRPKLALPCGDATVLDCVVAAVRAAGVEHVLVVVAPDADDLERLAVAAGARVLKLTVETPDMRATCQHGLAWLEEHFHPAEEDGWLLLPADHPTVRPGVVRALLEAAPGHSIVVPVFQGRRGHPTWLRWSHVNGIRALAPDIGLNSFIRAHVKETLELDWPSDEVLRDLDTPEDYERLMKDSDA